MTFLSMPAPEDPMLNRPELRMFIATLNPPPNSPMTFSKGTGVLSKNTSHAKMNKISRGDVTARDIQTSPFTSPLFISRLEIFISSSQLGVDYYILHQLLFWFRNFHHSHHSKFKTVNVLENLPQAVISFLTIWGLSR